ncbi:MAG: response regulator [Caulobacteraceae bacterium]|nr:response regulator [Caulobacteraceae bacterium]
MAVFVDQVPHVAVVDDDPLMRESILTLIESLGHRVSAFDSAEAFLAADAKRTTDCIIADMQMPGLSGMDLQAVLAADGFAIPFIFITALPPEDPRRRVLEASGRAFLIKPFAADALISHICAALAVD